MRLLMIVPYYSPDLGPSAPLFTMLANRLVSLDHKVTVITTVPHYPTGDIPASYRGKWLVRFEEEGVEVIRIGLPSMKRSNLTKRLIQFGCYQIGATWAGISKHYDAVFVANPALWVWLPFAWLVVVRKMPAIFSIHDVYPDVGITLGIFRHRPVIAAVASLERFCLKHASTVRILSDSFRPGIHALGVPESKITLVYDWVDTDLIRPQTKDNRFAREHDLVDRFIVLYAGNLGRSQGLEHVLAAAEQLSTYPDLYFVFVGDGAAREFLAARSEQLGLKNTIFIPFQPRERLPEVLASADISLVSLRKGLGSGSLPSKTFSILASGRPIVASIDPGSETWKLIERAGAGLCVPPEDPVALANTILTLKQDQSLRKRLGFNGRIWAERYHSPISAAKEFERLFLEIINRQNQPDLL